MSPATSGSGRVAGHFQARSWPSSVIRAKAASPPPERTRSLVLNRGAHPPDGSSTRVVSMSCHSPSSPTTCSASSEESEVQEPLGLAYTRVNSVRCETSSMRRPSVRAETMADTESGRSSLVGVEAGPAEGVSASSAQAGTTLVAAIDSDRARLVTMPATSREPWGIACKVKPFEPRTRSPETVKVPQPDSNAGAAGQRYESGDVAAPLLRGNPWGSRPAHAPDRRSNG